MRKNLRVIFTGGSGLLGSEFKKILPDLIYPSESEFNITDFNQMDKYIGLNDCDILVHAAAYTSPPRIDKNPVKALEINIEGTANVVKLCMKHNIKMIYISTDYVFGGEKGNYKENDPVHPVNKYAWSKLGGECAVKMYDNSLIIRTTFGPNVFPYEKAFIDQWTSRESVSTITQMIAKLIDTDITGTIHVGGNRKTVFEFAKKLNPSKDIKELSRDEVNFKVPADTSLDCTQFNKLIK